jgi:hypothetical protein
MVSFGGGDATQSQFTANKTAIIALNFSFLAVDCSVVVLLFAKDVESKSYSIHKLTIKTLS